jgi:hypothetical protein
MSYLNLTAPQIFKDEASYTLDDFVKDFREKVKEGWGETIDKGNGNKTVFQGLLTVVVFASQHKPVKLISEITMGKSTKECLDLTQYIIDMYPKEIEVLEGLQMKMFLDNLKNYGVSDYLNLKLLNTDFRQWFKKALEYKENETTKH